MPPKYVIFLSGPIGAGKTTLGRALAAAIGAGFIDGDDHSDPTKPWYGSILQTSIAIVDTGHTLLRRHPAVVVAYPLTCINWIYFRRKFGDAGQRTLFITLAATHDAITAPTRGRTFSEAERQRIHTMLAEGYATSPFSDLVLNTDRHDFAATLSELLTATKRLMGDHPAAARE